MSVMIVPEELTRVIEQQVARGHTANPVEFLREAVQRYAATLDVDDDAVIAAADEGVADIEAGRFGAMSDTASLDGLLGDILREIAAETGDAEHNAKA